MSIILDPYAARSCPVKTQNRYDPTLETPPSQPDEALQELFAGGKAFEDEVMAALAGTSDVVDLREQADRTRALELTLEALAEGHDVVLGPQLPIDLAGHRKGQPDALVRGRDQTDGRPGYRPVEAKRHRVLEHSQTEQVQLFSRLDAPTVELEHTRFTFRPHCEGDLLQMAHYWRLLDAAGWAQGSTPVAGVIGTDQPFGSHQPVVSWVDLSHKFIRTFSRTSATGWKLRSPLERYDHEFGFRVKVAQVVANQDPATTSRRGMVSPIVVRECDHCTWWEACKPQLDDADLSLRISKSPLDVREISVLRSRGINTLDDLAHANVDDLLPNYLPEVAHRHGAESRLRLAARRAALMLAGVELERVNDEAIDLPSAELEIDFDIETSAGDRVYLWGFLVDDRSTDDPPYYKAISRFEDLDNAKETALAREAIDWLHQLVTDRPDTRVYHYSDYEVVHLMRLARRTGDEQLVERAAEVCEHFVDMFSLMKQNFFGTNGLGLKVVARSGPGFEWRDEDPGGLNSQKWFRDAVTGPDAAARAEARTRVLEYNEDDVRATHELRAWLRGLDD